jgi:putative DNA primase/helicase
MLSVLETALAYHAAGLGLLPVRPNGSKAPALWRGHPYLRRRPREEDLYRWFARGRNGIGIACGLVSGNLETLDVETLATYQAWRERVETQAPGLAGRLCWVRTPGHLGGPGMHGRYCCRTITIPGSRALAFGADPIEGGKAQLLIETRGEGSYAIAPGSPAPCHETGRTWEHVAGPDLLHIHELTPGEREVLLTSARALGCRPGQMDAAGQRRPRGGRRVWCREDDGLLLPDWPAILEPHGWQQVRRCGPVRYWRRPGKARGGWSATTGFCVSADGCDLLHVFSPNAHPFRQHGSYSRLLAFALLNHHGDYRAAAECLAGQGFSAPRAAPLSQRGRPEKARAARAGSPGAGGFGEW